MLQIILGCLIANIITITAITSIGYYFYNKNKDNISELKNNIIDSINEIKTTIDAIKKIVDKFPFK